MAQQSQATGAIGGAAQGAAMGAQVGGVYGAVIGGVIGGVAGFMSGGGEEEAMELAEAQAKWIERTSEENQRKMRLEADQVTGAAKAAVYASNLQYTGSPREYINDLSNEFRRDLEWEKTKTSVSAQMARKGGQIAADTIQRSSTASMLQGVSSAVSQFGSKLPSRTDAGVNAPSSDVAVNTSGDYYDRYSSYA